MSDRLKLFDYLNSLNHEKNHLLDDGDTQRIKDYPAFLANMSMSFHIDTIMDANEMNMVAHIPNKWNYDFYFYGVDKSKRFSKWPKKKSDDNVSLVARYYNISTKLAIQYLDLLTEEDLELMKERTNEGGR